MRVVVSGATGFLGGHVVRRLLERGDTVLALGRNAEAGARLAARGARFLPLDLAAAAASPDLEPADAFVHAAALSSAWGGRSAFMAANVEGTRNALALARRLGVRRFVHISSPSIYFRFADQLSVREDSALPRPVNAYAASKALAEKLARAATDMSPVLLRPRGIYGRGDKALLPRLVRAARRGPLPLLRGGLAVTDLTHVADVVGAIEAALGPAGDRAAGLAVNISGGEPLTIRRIVETACAAAGVTARWRALPVGLTLAGARLLELAAWLAPGQPEPVATAYSLGILAFSQTLDLKRAANLLGWRPAVSFAEGMSRL